MLRILEISWLLISVATGTISAYQFVTDGWQAAIWMLAITGVALLMYTVRKGKNGTTSTGTGWDEVPLGVMSFELGVMSWELGVFNYEL